MKAILKGYHLSSAQSLAASFTAGPVTITIIDNVGLNIATTGVTSNTGTFTVQHRIGDGSNWSAWASLTLSPSPGLSNADATWLVNLNQLPPGQIQVNFTPGGGTPNGTVDIWVSGCAVGG